MIIFVIKNLYHHHFGERIVFVCASSVTTHGIFCTIFSPVLLLFIYDIDECVFFIIYADENFFSHTTHVCVCVRIFYTHSTYSTPTTTTQRRRNKDGDFFDVEYTIYTCVCMYVCCWCMRDYLRESLFFLSFQSPILVFWSFSRFYQWSRT